MKDPYQTLGVDKTAQADVIRSLAKEYHPDKSKGNEEKFKEVADAYETLSDPNKKARYDQMQSNPFGGGLVETLMIACLRIYLEIKTLVGHLIKDTVLIARVVILQVF